MTSAIISSNSRFHYPTHFDKASPFFFFPQRFGRSIINAFSLSTEYENIIIPFIYQNNNNKKKIERMLGPQPLTHPHTT
jgi:hypothetical protein